MRDYTQEVTAYTKGHGQLFCSLLGYRPCHNADEVIAAKQYDADHDVKNPSGSVFCAHGAGFFVPWNQVFDYMHIDTSKRANRDSSEMENDVTEKKAVSYTHLDVYKRQVVSRNHVCREVW